MSTRVVTTFESKYGTWRELNNRKDIIKESCWWWDIMRPTSEGERGN